MLDKFSFVSNLTDKKMIGKSIFVLFFFISHIHFSFTFLPSKHYILSTCISQMFIYSKSKVKILLVKLT